MIKVALQKMFAGLFVGLLGRFVDCRHRQRCSLLARPSDGIAVCSPLNPLCAQLLLIGLPACPAGYHAGAPFL